MLSRVKSRVVLVVGWVYLYHLHCRVKPLPFLFGGTKDERVSRVVLAPGDHSNLMCLCIEPIMRVGA